MNKTFTAPLDIKSAGEGTIEAVFAFIGGEPDLDGDITRPGAFSWKSQEVVMEPWNHNYSQLPVGKGVIVEEGNKAVFRGSLFLSTTGGRDHWTAIRELGPLTKWSYTFNILKSSLGTHRGKSVRFLERLEVAGVGPVTAAAQPLTYTAAVKGLGKLPKTRAEVDAAIWAAELRMMHLEAAAIRRDLAKNAPEMSPAQMLQDIFLAHAQAEGFSREYALTILAARREAARQARLNARDYTPCYPEVRN